MLMAGFFTRTALLVTTGCLLVISLSGQVGGALPSRYVFLMENPCKLPCVYGLIPGETERTAALAIAERIAAGHVIYSLDSQSGMSMRIHTEAGVVLGMVTLDLPNSTLVRALGFSPAPETKGSLGSLGDLLAAGLQPTRVYRSCDTTIPRMLIAFSDQPQVIAELRLAEHLRPETPVTFLRVFASSDTTLSEALTSFGCAVETGWRGFAPGWVYFAEQ